MNDLDPRDPIDRELAEGFTHLHPPEDLMSVLIQAAQDRPIQTPVARPSRWLPTAVLGLAVAAVAAVVLQRGLAPSDDLTPPIPAEDPADRTRTLPPIPAGMRAVTLDVALDHVSSDDLQNEALVDVLFLTANATRTLLEEQLVLASDDEGRLTLAVDPTDAEVLMLAREQGLVVPVIRRGREHLVTVPVDMAALRTGLVVADMHTDVLLYTHGDDGPTTLTLVQAARVHRIHDDRVTLALADGKVVERLVHGSQIGRLSLSLRGE